ncbi:MAG: (d)CMP kinase, partial [Glaciecola sp.]
MTKPISIVTVDGPSGAGKGTLSANIANYLKWHFLDSGAIYRVLAVACQHHGIDVVDEESVLTLASKLDVKFFKTARNTRRNRETLPKRITHCKHPITHTRDVAV